MRADVSDRSIVPYAAIPTKGAVNLLDASNDREGITISVIPVKTGNQKRERTNRQVTRVLRFRGDSTIRLRYNRVWFSFVVQIKSTAPKEGIQTRAHPNRLVPLDLRFRGDDAIRLRYNSVGFSVVALIKPTGPFRGDDVPVRFGCGQ